VVALQDQDPELLFFPSACYVFLSLYACLCFIMYGDFFFFNFFFYEISDILLCYIFNLWHIFLRFVVK